MKPIGYTLFALALGLTLLTACSKNMPDAGSGEEPYTISFSVPGARTKGMSQTQEQTVEHVDLLLFEKDGAQEKFVEHRAFAAGTFEDGAPVKTLRTELSAAAGKEYRVVLIANAADEVQGATLIPGTEKEATLDALLSFVSTPEWDLTRPLPMWGESEKAEALNPRNPIPSIQMLRAVARIDVVLSQELIAAGKFELEYVRIYNHYSAGRLTPAPGTYSTVTQSVSGPNIPAGAALVQQPLIYTATGPNDCTAEIYLSEYDNTTAGESLRLLVGGSYNGGPTTWYTVNLTDKATGQRFDLVRNFRYVVTLTDVSSAGVTDPDEIYSSTVIPADVVPWNENGAVNPNVQGDYFLKVSQTNFRFNADPRSSWEFRKESIGYTDFLIDIETDHPDGWKISRVTDTQGNELTGDARWVTIGKGIRHYDEENRFAYEDLEQCCIHMLTNTGTEARSARIHIQAGSLEYVVHVTQDYLDCGRDGQVKEIEFQGRKYTTHIMFDSRYQYMLRCFMMENLYDTYPQYNDDENYVVKEYPGSDKLPSEESRGYYFWRDPIVEQGFNPCPPGWHIPVVLDFMVINSYFYDVHPEWGATNGFIYEHNLPNRPLELQMFMNEKNFGGYLLFDNSTNQTSAQEWGTFTFINYAYTKINNNPRLFPNGIAYEPDTPGYGSPVYIRGGSTHFDPDRYHQATTVRCVKDM